MYVAMLARLNEFWNIEEEKRSPNSHLQEGTPVTQIISKLKDLLPRAGTKSKSFHDSNHRDVG